MNRFAYDIASRSAHARPSRRGGFTLVELLVVIGIIAVLTAIVAVGIFSLLPSASDRASGTRLEALQTMYIDWAVDESATVGQGSQAGERPLPSAVQSAWGGAEQPPSAIEDATGVYAGTSQNHQVAAFWAQRTQEMIKRMNLIPANRELWDALPASAKTQNMGYAATITARFRTGPTGFNTGTIAPALVFNDTANNTSATLEPPMLLDGHGHLIFWVPPTGLQGMILESDPSWNDGSAGLNQGGRLLPVDGKGFFISPGADGNYQTHDDNVYSTTLRKAPAN